MYVGKVHDKRRGIRSLEEKAKDSRNIAHGKKLEFQRTEVRRIITHLSNKFDLELSEEDDEEIKKRKDELVSDLKLLQTIPKKIEELFSEGERECEIVAVKELYDDLFATKDIHI